MAIKIMSPYRNVKGYITRNVIVQIKNRSRRIKKNKAEWIIKHNQTNR